VCMYVCVCVCVLQAFRVQGLGREGLGIWG